MNDIIYPDGSDPGQKKIIKLYAAFGAGLLLSMIPFFIAAFLSMVFVFGVLVAAYIIRTGDSKDGLTHNHATYVIRTIWIGSFLAMLMMTLASLYLFYILDNRPLDPCIQHFLAMGPETMMTINMMALKEVFTGCYKNYWTTNFTAFLIAGAIAVGPVLLYFIIRYARGLSRALDGYRIARPEAWL